MRAIQSYRRTSVESAPNEDVLVLLIEAALKRETAAAAAMERGDRAAWVAELHVARAVFMELRQALDHKAFPETAGSLDQTYRWCIHQITAAGRTGDVELIGKIHRVTEVIHETWSRAVALSRGMEDDRDLEAAS